MYKESSIDDIYTITMKCDARKGAGICQNQVSVTMLGRDTILELLYDMGWRMLRAHQVCGSCVKNKRISFPRLDKESGK